MKIYLAGPINGCTDGEALDWRKTATGALESHGHTVIDPTEWDMRGMELDGDTPSVIVERDLRLIESCDCLLVGAWKPSVGTSMEVWEAKVHMGKRIVVWCPNPRPSPWLVFCADVVELELGRAIEAVISGGQ